MCSFDTEVRDSFHKHKCDPFFTGIDHTSGMDAMAAPPQFEMVEYTPVEYEAVEYEAAEFEGVEYEGVEHEAATAFKTIDYEEFTQ